MRTISNWFYTTKLGGLYFEFLLWYDRWKFKQETKKYIHNKETARIIINHTKALYRDGLKQVKIKVAELTTAPTAEEYDRVLNEIEDIVSLAKLETNNEIKALKLINGDLTKTKDVENNTDKAKMIKQRIAHYEELKKYNKKRTLIKAIKLAIKEGNKKLAEELEEQWSKEYGKRRFARSYKRLR